jgi:hypothetical protein
MVAGIVRHSETRLNRSLGCTGFVNKVKSCPGEARLIEQIGGGRLSGEQEDFACRVRAGALRAGFLPPTPPLHLRSGHELPLTHTSSRPTKCFPSG